MISWLSSTNAKYFVLVVLFFVIVTGFLFLLSSHSSPSQLACWVTWTENKSRGRTFNYKFLYILFLVLSISLIVMYTSLLGQLASSILPSKMTEEVTGGVNNATIEGWYSNNTVILICNKILKFSFGFILEFILILIYYLKVLN